MTESLVLSPAVSRSTIHSLNIHMIHIYISFYILIIKTKTYNTIFFYIFSIYILDLDLEIGLTTTTAASSSNSSGSWYQYQVQVHTAYSAGRAARRCGGWHFVRSRSRATPAGRQTRSERQRGPPSRLGLGLARPLVV